MIRPSFRRIVYNYIESALMFLYQRSWFRSIVIPLITIPKCKKYIFIVGCYNSGTTLLNHLLTNHEEISGLPTEGVMLTNELRTPEQFGWNRMWHMCQQNLEISGLPKKPNADRIKKEWAFWYNRNKTLFIEKSIINSLYIDWLEINFDHPFFIWIIRNGYAVSEGIRRRSQNIGKHHPSFPNGYPIEMCARQWVLNNEAIQAKISKTRYFTYLTYEELTEQTISSLNSLMHFLPVKNKIIRVTDDFAFHNTSMPIKNMNSTSISHLSRLDIAKINLIASDMLKLHNYNILI